MCCVVRKDSPLSVVFFLALLFDSLMPRVLKINARDWCMLHRFEHPICASRVAQEARVVFFF